MTVERKAPGVTRLLRASVFLLRRYGDGAETPDDWRTHVCRCLHRRSDHYGACMKCGCQQFRLRVAIGR